MGPWGLIGQIKSIQLAMDEGNFYKFMIYEIPQLRDKAYPCYNYITKNKSNGANHFFLSSDIPNMKTLHVSSKGHNYKQLDETRLSEISSKGV